ncbi:gene transfer agent family protein [Pikeienuella sp. HZG-20]|uniref:gene transfer agent family protein n=1 Tax=Paludibacillus litoralis TaxID=3133267 RepID=UPI0030EDED97
MVNPQRGEIAITIDGEERVLRLTLGALAALEARLDVGGLAALAERFEAGGFRAADLIALLAAGLQGGGADVTEAEVAAMNFDGGAIGAAEAASRLLAASFRGTT